MADYHYDDFSMEEDGIICNAHRTHSRTGLGFEAHVSFEEEDVVPNETENNALEQDISVTEHDMKESQESLDSLQNDSEDDELNEESLRPLKPPKGALPKLLHNTNTILSYTNATMIKQYKVGVGYYCIYCPEFYKQPMHLKSHVLEEHPYKIRRKHPKTGLSGVKLHDFISKLDVTSLVCLICDEPMVSLEEVMDHLRTDHKKKLYPNATSQILPFSFADDKLKCVVCSKEFPTFNFLCKHMLVHNGNFQCPKCEKRYFTFSALKNHYKRHVKGKLTCNYCSRTFHRECDRKLHERHVHLSGREPNKCAYCGEDFDTYQKRFKHLMEVHGAESASYECEFCNRVYTTYRAMMYHINYKHMNNRKFECTFCDKKFLSRRDLQNHENTHTMLNKYECCICSKSFKNNSALWLHMKIHTNDRRHKCEFCDLGFLTKVNLLKHLWAKHRGPLQSEIKDGETTPCKNIEGKPCGTALDKIEPTGVSTVTVESLVEIKEEITSDVDEKTEGDSVEVDKSENVNDKKLMDLVPIKRDIDKHLHNIHTIILYTNATPIKYFNLGLGYSCQYCRNRYMNPADLKTHTLEDHDVNEKTSFLKKPNTPYSVREFIAKLDVTALICFICRETLENLDKATEHLINNHNKTLYTDIKSQIIPFSYNGEKWICVNCKMQFNTFNMVQTHMNLHYGNFQCPVCDRAYVNFRTLNTHYNTHKQGDFKCRHCTESFNTLVKRSYHEKAVHLAGKNRNKCPHCEKSFSDYYQRLHHMVEVHGAEPLSLKCNVCEARFKTQRSLTVHIRNVHLMERKHECKYCNKMFFRRDCLKDHMSIHSGKKEYQCDICKKAYMRKSTLKEHMRSHIEDKKYKCEHCSLAYVMKFSWKSHMKIKHGETVD